MRFLKFILVTLLLFYSSSSLYARGSSGRGHSSYHSTKTHYKVSSLKRASTKHSSRRAKGVARDKHGRIKRSAASVNHFKKSHPCPSTGRSSGSCPGYIVDHIKPLKRGGADSSSNMQWQTKEEAKAKDKWE
jgi:5-methylcytosine-specific restriction endonuclease McrA